MSLTTSFKSLTLSTPFLHGTSPSFSRLSKPSLAQPTNTPTSLPQIRAMRTLQGRVVCATSDKTVAVEVVRLAPHPKYKRRVRIKKKFQAHDPENKFKVGDIVQLEKCRPISKTKAFLAIPAPDRTQKRNKGEEKSGEIGIPMESQSQSQQQAV